MAWFSVAVLCAFLLFKEYIHVSSTGSEKSLQLLQLRIGRVNITKEVRDGERSFLSSSLDDPDQVQRRFIEDKIVTTGKSVDDDDTFENDNLSPGDRKQTTHNFDNILKSFDAKVNKLERKLRSESNIVLYSSQETQNSSTGIAPENENTTEVLSIASENISTKAVDSVATSSSIGKPSFPSSQTVSTVSFTFISTTKGEISPTPSTSLHSLNQTAGAHRTSALSVSITLKTTPSPSISLSTVGGNIFITKALDRSPVLGDVTPSISEIIKAHTPTVLSYNTTIVVEAKPATDQPLSTKIPSKSDSTSPSIELLSPNPTEATTANNKINIRSKSKTTQPKEKKKGLFRHLSIEILIALVAGALCALLLLAFLVYRLKKRNEGSYDLSETLYMKIRTQDELGMKKEVFV